MNSDSSPKSSLNSLSKEDNSDYNLTITDFSKTGPNTAINQEKIQKIDEAKEEEDDNLDRAS